MAVTITRTANPVGVAAVSTIATYSAASIGVATDDRIIVVVVGTELANSTPSACTINSGGGAVSMTAATSANGGVLFSQIFYLKVTSGTTADIAVTYSSVSPTATANHIAVYRVIGAATALESSGGDSSLDMDATDRLTTGSNVIPTGGAFLAIASCAVTTGTKTWAEATIDIDEDAGTFWFTTAISTTGGTATRTCTGTNNGEDGAMSWVVFFDRAAPTVTTQSVSSISFTTATGNGNVTSDGGSAITERGVVWKISTTPTTADSKATSIGTTGAFTVSMTGLLSNTLYYVRAYAINDEGTSYGSQVTFTTLDSPPTVTTQSVSSISSTAATGNGNVTSNIGSAITERGIVWKTSTIPTTADSKATSAGTTGAFTAAITGLTANTLYYVRAYAINSASTSYGSEVTFTTLDSSPTVELNSPADEATDQLTTPALLFTGTDLESHEIEYNLELWAATATHIADFYYDTYPIQFVVNTASSVPVDRGQSFTGDGRLLTSARFYLYQSAGPVGNIVAKIYAHSGNFGTTSITTGSALATSENVAAATIVDGFVTFLFIGSNRIVLESGTRYVVMYSHLSLSPGQIGFKVKIQLAPSTVSHPGNTLWSLTSYVELYDTLFDVNTAQRLNKLSVTPDAGFSGTGDPAPWPSGNQVTYTVQANNTLVPYTKYFWRVRGKDPSGSNTFGVWSATKSFTTGASKVLGNMFLMW